jgi:hypothetical protein
MTKARDISKLLSTANGKIAGENLDVSFENITDTGTTGTRVATGTTAQRGSTAGQLRFNSTTGLAEYYNGAGFTKIEGTPVITSISPNNIDVDSNPLPQNISINGENFQSGATVTFIDSSGVSLNSTSVTFNSVISLTATVPSSVNVIQQPFDIRVNNPTGLSATLNDGLQLSASPAWNTASGLLGSTGDRENANIQLSATDPDGGAVTFAETGGTVLSTAGLSISSSGLISGTPNDVVSNTTINFTIRATDNEGAYTDRNFSLTITYQLDGSSARPFAKISDADDFNAGTYYIADSASTNKQLYFYKFNGYAYATVGSRYQSSSNQTNINTDSSVGTADNGTTTFHLSTTQIRYLTNVSNNSDVLGMIMVPQQASGALTQSQGNLFRSSTTDRSIPSDIFTNNHAGEANGVQSILWDLGNSNPNTNYPASGNSNWTQLQSNAHEGGNQILSTFDDNSLRTGNETTGAVPFGIRYSNNNGTGYHSGSPMNDVTDAGRNLTGSPIISLFLLAR